MSVGSPTAGTWSSSQWWPDNEFETDRFAERGVALSLSYDPTPSTPGGLLIVDNMLWGGRIFDAADRSAATEGVRALTRALASRPSWISSLMPIRDGMMAWQPGS